MKKIKSIQAIVAIGSLIASSTIFAANHTTDDGSGFYVGGQFGYDYVIFGGESHKQRSEDANVSNFDDQNSTFNYGINLGYQFNHVIGVEVDLNNFTGPAKEVKNTTLYETTTNSSPFDSETTKTKIGTESQIVAHSLFSITPAVVATWHFNQHWFMLGKLGASIVWDKQNLTKTKYSIKHNQTENITSPNITEQTYMAYAGLGMGYQFTQHLSAQLITNFRTNVKLTDISPALAVQYRF